MKKTKLEIVTVKATSSVHPPLKRSELVEALARKLIEQKTAEKHEAQARHNAAEVALHEEAKRLASISENLTPPDISFDFNWNSVSRTHDLLEVSVIHHLTPSALQQLKPAQSAYLKTQETERASIVIPSLRDAMREVRAMLDGQPVDRVGTVLSNPETSKALADMLAALQRKIGRPELTA